MLHSLGQRTAPTPRSLQVSTTKIWRSNGESWPHSIKGL